MTEKQRIRFECLISRIDRFKDMIPRPTPVAAIGRHTHPQTSAQPAGAVLERTKLAQQLREWKEQNL